MNKVVSDLTYINNILGKGSSDNELSYEDCLGLYRTCNSYLENKQLDKLDTLVDKALPVLEKEEELAQGNNLNYAKIILSFFNGESLRINGENGPALEMLDQGLNALDEAQKEANSFEEGALETLLSLRLNASKAELLDRDGEHMKAYLILLDSVPGGEKFYNKAEKLGLEEITDILKSPLNTGFYQLADLSNRSCDYTYTIRLMRKSLKLFPPENEEEISKFNRLRSNALLADALLEIRVLSKTDEVLAESMAIKEATNFDTIDELELHKVFAKTYFHLSELGKFKQDQAKAVNEIHKAIREQQKAIELSPEPVNEKALLYRYYNHLAALKNLAKESEEAIETAKVAVDGLKECLDNPNVDRKFAANYYLCSIYELAKAYLGAERHEENIRTLDFWRELALQNPDLSSVKNPHNVGVVFLNRGYSNAQLGNYEEALADSEKALEVLETIPLPLKINPEKRLIEEAKRSIEENKKHLERDNPH